MAQDVKEILLDLLKCLLVFYAVFFIMTTICYGAFKLPAFDPKMPFDFKTWLDLSLCCASYSAHELANFICMQSAYLVSTCSFTIFLRERIWDYAITVTVFHILLSCLVMLDFPLNWSWWVCLGAALFLMICLGELVAFTCKETKKKRAKRKVSPMS